MGLSFCRGGPRGTQTQTHSVPLSYFQHNNAKLTSTYLYLQHDTSMNLKRNKFTSNTEYSKGYYSRNQNMNLTVQ